MYPVIVALGWLLARLPLCVSQGLAWVLGTLLFLFPSPRRRILLSNLHHAFPEKTEAWRRRIARVSCVRTIELGLFNLVSAFMPQERYLRCLDLVEEDQRTFEEALKEGRPMLMLGAHFSMIESFNAWPALSRFSMPETGVLYRPYKNRKVDALIKRNRERAGARLFSRREGFSEFGRILSRGGLGAILYDQNAGGVGSLIPFFGRLSSATELPGLFAKKYRAIVWMGHAERLSFFRARLHLKRLEADMTDPEAVTLASNAWLESRLSQNDDWCGDWLWTHNRWKILHHPHECLGMNHKKSLVDFGASRLRSTRIWVIIGRNPLEIGQVREFFEALHKSRPDSFLTLVGKEASGFTARYPGLVDDVMELPDRALSRAFWAWKQRAAYIDTCIVIGDDPNLAFTAWLTGARVRLGLNKTGGRGQWLSAASPLSPEDTPGSWVEAARSFGLEPEGPFRQSEPLSQTD